MHAVFLRSRAEMRARWRGWVSLTLIVGLFAGTVIAVAAGARRTDSAYPRLLAATNAYDLGVPKLIGTGTGVFGSVRLSDVDHLPQVRDSSRIRIYDTPNDNISANAPMDSRSYVSVERPKLLAGRMPRPNAPLEIAVNWLQAQALRVTVGDTLPQRFLLKHAEPGGHHDLLLPLRVVGIEAAAGEFPPHLTNPPAFIMSRAFDRTYGDRLQDFPTSLLVLKGGLHDIPTVLKEIQQLAHHKILFVLRQDTSAANVQRSLHLQATALWLLAALTGLVLLLVLGQTLSRQTFLESTENATLRSLGMTKPQLMGVAFFRAAVVGLAGVALAVATAILASPLFPTGLARIAEPDNGIRVDPLALGLGALAILVVVAALSVIPAWRAAKADPSREDAFAGRPSTVTSAVARSGIPVSGVAGVRMALEPGRGRTAVPVRTAMIGVTVGIAALAAALTFGASLTHLLDTPPLYGVTWDVQVYANQNFPTRDIALQLSTATRNNPQVSAFGLGTTGLSMSVDGTAADALLIYHRPDGVEPPILSGRAPSRSGEIALGSKTLDQIHKGIGDTVSVSVFGSRAKPMKIVGEAVTPPIGDVGQFGSGALVDYRSADYLVPGAPAADTVFVRVVPGADPLAVGHAIASQVPGVAMQVSLPTRPSDLVNFGRVHNFPLYLAALVALMAAAMLAHVLVTSIRRRRRDLAVLKTMGFQRRQVTSTVAWQATVLTLVALVIGLPLGIAAGRWIWTSFADQLGILPAPAIPYLAVLVSVPATLLLANLIAYLPGRSAARVPAATVLRTE